ncbi:unnamed protein product [Cylindrotheca closterium]|uniref:FAS1 domain-containing protein n=1 Tax=Cylindrotheca closterium TaxID=2856 RepID=A0AAD2CK81_9STRA|nr:unnamed protein product [Cylindrotheca closterium]
MKFLATLSLLAATVTPVASQSIIDLAAADGKYGTLLNAVTNTPGVLDTITANFPVTIFGPTDTAFGDISEVVAGLDESALATVLASHVVAGVVTAEDVIDAGCVELRSLSGAQLRVAFENGRVTVNESNVIQADITGEGGVIHGINKVILPGTFTACGDLAKGSKKGGVGSKGSKKSSGSSMSSGKGGSSGKGSSMSSGKGSRRGA